MNDEFLSQDEIDALLKGGPQPDNEPEPEDEPADVEESASVREDEGGDLTEIERDALAEIGNISMGSAATALSSLINQKVSITVPEVYVSTVDDISQSYPVPCIVISVGYTAGLQGRNYLVISEKDAAVIGSLMMGEDGRNPPEEIDELYLSAVTEAMNMMMGSAATAMSDLFHYMIDITPPDAHQKNLAIDPFDLLDTHRTVAIVAFRIQISDLIDSTMLQIIELDFAREMVAQLIDPQMPDDVDEGAVEKTNEPPVSDSPPQQPEASEQPKSSDPASLGATTETAAMAETPTASWNDLKAQSRSLADMTNGARGDELGNLNVDLIRNIPVHVRAVLGKTRMSIEDILKLGPGNIMELETMEGDPIDIYANDTLIAKGEVVVIGEQFGLRITEISTPSNRIKSVQ